jgi:rare lipoprotein A (peptidoglycan hydrolase)
MVAAACGKLRTAMGPHWRGQTVTVMNNANGVIVVVKLVDWCGSSDKTIDLYYIAMAKLGGTGVLNVTVRW